MRPLDESTIRKNENFVSISTTDGLHGNLPTPPAAAPTVPPTANAKEVAPTRPLTLQDLGFPASKANGSRGGTLITWDFLLEMLRARGFSDLWIAWIRNILVSSTSFLKINGLKGALVYARVTHSPHSS
jgi:hypothetical protein